MTNNAKIEKTQNKINFLQKQKVLLGNELKKGENKKIRNKLLKIKNLVKNLQDQINKIKKEELGTTNSSRKDDVLIMTNVKTNKNIAVDNTTAKTKESQGENKKSIKIDRQKQIPSVLKYTKGISNQSGYNVLRIIFDYDVNDKNLTQSIITNNILCKVIKKPYNAMADYMDINTKVMPTSFGSMTKTQGGKWNCKHAVFAKIRRSTYDEIEIQAVNGMAAKKIVHDIKDIVIDRRNDGNPYVYARIGIVMPDKTKKEIMVLLSERFADEPRSACNTRTKKKCFNIEHFLDNSGNYKQGLLVYPMFNSTLKERSRHNSSAAALKANTMTVFEASAGAKTIEAFDKVCSNVTGRIYEYGKRNAVSLSKIYGFFNRIGMSTPSVTLFNTNKIYTKVDVILTSTFGKENGKDFEDWCDGQDYLTAEFYAKAIDSASDGKFEIDPSTLIGKHIQSRLYFAHKAKSQIISQKEINYVVKKLSEKYEVVMIRKDQVTKEIQEQFDEAVLGKKGDFYGKILVVYDKSVKNPLSAIDSLTDLNALKSSYDLKARSNVNMLKDIVLHKPTDIGASLSNQMLQTCLEANYEDTIAYIRKLLIEQVFSRFDDIKTCTNCLRAESFDSIKIDTATLLAQVAPNYVLNHDRNLFKSLFNNTVKGAVKDLNEIGIKFAGAYAAVVPDVSSIYDARFLHICEDAEGTTYIEVLSKSAEQNNVKELVMVKYPKNHLQENAYCKVVSVKEYCKRVDKCNTLTNEEKTFIKDNASKLNEGCVMIPSYSIIKNMLAGLDFDSDAVQMFYDKFIVDTYKKVGMKAVIIEEPSCDETNSRYNYDESFGLHAWYEYCKQDRETVGEVTIMNMILISLRHMLKYGSQHEKNKAKEIFNLIFSKGGKKYMETCSKMKSLATNLYGKNSFAYKKMTCEDEKFFHEYHISLKEGIQDSIPYVKINIDDATRIIFAAYHMDKDDEKGILECIDKLLIVQRMYQELTIDAVKKGYVFSILYKTKDVAKLLSRSEFELSINWKNIDKTLIDNKIVNFKDNAKNEYVGIENFTETKETNTTVEINANGKENVIYNIADPMHIVKVQTMPTLGNKMQQFVNKMQTVHPEIEKMIKKVLENKDLALLIKAIFAEKANYSNLTSAMKEELFGVKEDVEKQAIKARYNEFFAALSNNIRCLFAMNNVTDNNTKVAVLLASTAVFDEVSETYSIDADTWSFASKVCSEEYAKFVIKNFGEVTTTYNKVIESDPTVLDGDEVEFTNGIGICKNGGYICVTENINGDFTFREDKNGNKWVEKDIVNTITIPEPDFSKRFIVTTEHEITVSSVKDSIEKYTMADNVLKALVTENNYSYIELFANAMTARAKQEAGTIRLFKKENKSLISITGDALYGATGKMLFKLGRNALRRDFYNKFIGNLDTAIRGRVSRYGKIKTMVFAILSSKELITPETINRKALNDKFNNVSNNNINNNTENIDVVTNKYNNISDIFKIKANSNNEVLTFGDTSQNCIVIKDEDVNNISSMDKSVTPVNTKSKSKSLSVFKDILNNNSERVDLFKQLGL